MLRATSTKPLQSFLLETKKKKNTAKERNHPSLSTNHSHTNTKRVPEGHQKKISVLLKKEEKKRKASPHSSKTPFSSPSFIRFASSSFDEKARTPTLPLCDLTPPRTRTAPRASRSTRSCSPAGPGSHPHRPCGHGGTCREQNGCRSGCRLLARE